MVQCSFQIPSGVNSLQEHNKPSLLIILQLQLGGQHRPMPTCRHNLHRYLEHFLHLVLNTNRSMPISKPILSNNKEHPQLKTLPNLFYTK
jgi:hypothetical protein